MLFEIAFVYNKINWIAFKIQLHTYDNTYSIKVLKTDRLIMQIFYRKYKDFIVTYQLINSQGNIQMLHKRETYN